MFVTHHQKKEGRHIHVPASFGSQWGISHAAAQIEGILKASPGEFVSGEQICRKLEVSRSGVWKAIQDLRRHGYRIRASKHHGYRLVHVPDFLQPEIVRDGLRTRVLGRDIFSFRRVSSTNDVGVYLAEHGAPDGCVVTAEGQWRGRGRLRRRWVSPAGKGLCFSVLLRPALASVHAQVLTFLAAVAAAKAMRAVCGAQVSLKWPNDLMVDGRKVGGVLTEFSAEADLIRYAVVGIGLNVNMNSRDFGSALRGSAVSLLQIVGGRVARVKLLRAVIEEMDSRYETVKDGGDPAGIVKEWREMTPIVGSIVRVEHLGHAKEGTVAGVDDDGALLLRGTSGTLERLMAGDVTILR